MSNYSIYSENLVDATLTLNTITANTDYPLTNLNDINKNTIFKEGTGNTSGYIAIDFGATRDCDFLALVNHNYSNTGIGIKLAIDENDNPAFPDPYYVLGAAGAYHDYVAANANLWVETFSSADRQYWRLYLEAMGAGTYQQIGSIFLGAAFDFDHNPNFEIPEESGYLVNSNEAIGGTTFSQIANTTVRRMWDLTYELVDTTEKAVLETFRDNIFMNWNGGLSRYPFVFTDDGGTTFYFAKAEGSLVFTLMAYQLYSVNLRFREEL